MIILCKMHNREKFIGTYGKLVPSLVEKHGGEYIVRGGESMVIEGKWAYPRTVVIKFPSYEKAIKFYNSDEYKPIKQIRLENAESNAIIIEGA